MALNAIDQGECPYLPKRRWVSHAFISEQMPPEVYQGMLHDGWRRSGSVFYRNTCPGCSLCIPIRTDVAAFRPSKSQRRILRRNFDVRISYREAAPDRDLFDLYQRYQRERHKQDNTEEETWESFVSFLGSSPVPSLVMRYHVGDELMGAGWIDLLPEGPSSVYFVFDPRFQSRSPGTFSVLQEIRLALDLNRPWLYLGFFVPSCRSMSYKARFKPYELLIDGCWTRWQ